MNRTTGSVAGRTAANPETGRSPRFLPTAWLVDPTASVRLELDPVRASAPPELTTPPGAGAGRSAPRATAVPRRDALDDGTRLGVRELSPLARTGADDPLPPPEDDDPPLEPPDEPPDDPPEDPDEPPPTGRGIA